MRSIIELFVHLRSVNITLSLDGDALKCSAPQGVLTSDLRQELADRKPEIVAFLRESQKFRHSSEMNIPRIDRSGPLPLSFAQQRLWFLSQMDPESSVNNIGIALRMKGPLSVPAVEQAFAEIVSRHEDLRTSFVRVNGVPHAVIGDGKNWSLQVEDAKHLLRDGDDSELLRYANQLTFQPFDVSRGPLFRAHLLTVAPEDHILALIMHHIISDGWSIGVLVREFSELYSASARGVPILFRRSLSNMSISQHGSARGWNLENWIANCRTGKSNWLERRRWSASRPIIAAMGQTCFVDLDLSLIIPRHW